MMRVLPLPIICCALAVVAAGTATDLRTRLENPAERPRLAAQLANDNEWRGIDAGSVRNVRDLGAIPGAEKLRRGMLFRGAALSSNRLGRLASRGVPSTLDDAAVECLFNALGIRTVIDLRTTMEAGAKRPEKLPADVRYHNIPILPYAMADYPASRDAFHRIMQILADDASYPVYFFCQHGTDRTGTLAFLLEGLLGINPQSRFRDWLQSITAYPECFDRQYSRGYGALQLLIPDECADGFDAFAAKCQVAPETLENFRRIMDGMPR